MTVALIKTASDALALQQLQSLQGDVAVPPADTWKTIHTTVTDRRRKDCGSLMFSRLFRVIRGPTVFDSLFYILPWRRLVRTNADSTE